MRRPQAVEMLAAVDNLLVLLRKLSIQSVVKMPYFPGAMYVRRFEQRMEEIKKLRYE